MLTSNKENTPIQLIDGKPRVIRSPFKPTKEQKKGGGWFDGLGDGEQLAIMAFFTILLVLLTPALLVISLPVKRMWQEAYRIKPTPPGAKEFFWPVVLTAIVPGLISSLGFLELLLSQASEHLGFLKFLARYLYPDGWLLCLAVIPCYLLFFSYFIWKGMSDTRAVREYQEREEAETQAQRELEAQTEAEEQARLSEERRTLDNSFSVVLGEYYHRKWDGRKARWVFSDLVGFERGELCYLTLDHLSRHVLVVAPTRAGKTYNVIRPILEECRLAGHAVIILDPKGNEFEPGHFDVNFSLQSSEATSSIRLCLVDPELEPLKAAQKLAEALIRENREQPFFSEASRLALVAFMVGHRAVFGEFPELWEVLTYTTGKEKRALLTTKLGELLAEENRDLEERVRVQEALQFMSVAEQRASNIRSDALGSLYNALLPLATGQYRSYVTTNPRFGLTIRQLLNRKLQARIAFTADEGEIGSALGKIVVQQYTDAVLSPRMDKSYLKLLILDEAHNYVCEALRRGVVQAAGNNAGYVLAFQSLKQIPDENTRSIIFGNCKNRFVLTGVEYSDAELFSKEFGEDELEFYTSGSSEGDSTSQSDQTATSYSSGKNTGKNSGGTNSSTISSSNTNSESSSNSKGTSTSRTSTTTQNLTYQRRPLWLPRELAQIPRYHAVALLDDGKSEAQPRLVSFGKYHKGLVFQLIKEKVVIEETCLVRHSISQVEALELDLAPSSDHVSEDNSQLGPEELEAREENLAFPGDEEEQEQIIL